MLTMICAAHWDKGLRLLPAGGAWPSASGHPRPHPSVLGVKAVVSTLAAH